MASATQFDTHLLINGNRVAGTGPAETIINPATGAVLCKVPEAGPEQVDAAVAAAGEAFADW